jgi:glycosyltransferase A (GT-A) superfamily protein (DUF2064 family)
VEWGGEQVLTATLANIEALGWSVWKGDPLADVDEPADLRHAPPSWLVDKER